MTGNALTPPDFLYFNAPAEALREAQARAKESERHDVTQLEDGTLVVPMRGLLAKTIVSADAQRAADSFCAFGPLGSEPP